MTFKADGSGEGSLNRAQLFIGDYEARAVPVADTDPTTATGDTFKLLAGTHVFIVRADGYGAKRFTATLRPGQVRDLPVTLERNLASASNGATATGDGVNLDKLIDDTEATNWASLGSDVVGKQVTVQLDPSKSSHQIRRVQVSAMLRPTQAHPGGDTGSQSRYSALRQFSILTCTAGTSVNCTEDADFQVVFTSPEDAFPSIAPRPRAPELILRSFAIPQTRATHVRLEVVHNQCTGAPDYRGDQDDDPRHNTDCVAGSTQGTNVRAAELQVFSR